jgi:hypothetical protein
MEDDLLVDALAGTLDIGIYACKIHPYTVINPLMFEHRYDLRFDGCNTIPTLTKQLLVLQTHLPVAQLQLRNLLEQLCGKNTSLVSHPTRRGGGSSHANIACILVLKIPHPHGCRALVARPL